MSIESAGDLTALTRVGHVVALTLDALHAAARVGISTAGLDAVAAANRDDWTIRTANGCLAVHEEHTVVIRDGAPLVLTALQ